MDKKSATRVDGVYRSIKQLPLLGCLGLLIPIIGILLLPIAIVYSRVMSGLLRDFESGKLVIEDHDRISEKPGELSTEQKLDFLQNGDTRMWVPYLTGSIWVLLILFVVIFVAAGK